MKSHIAVAAALALAVAAAPAGAKDHPGHGPDKAKAQAHECQAHGHAFVVGGTLDSGTLTANPDGTYTGTLVVTVRRANHHARADRGTSKTYTLDNANVNLHGQDPAALTAGSRVQLLGRVSRLNKSCDQTGFTAATTIRRANVRAPKAAETPAAPAAPETPETPETPEAPAAS
jgi:hypothetical protein